MLCKRILSKSGPPIHLIWFVTNRCSLQCAHCFSDAAALSGSELKLEEIQRAALRLTRCLAISLTGGEPFLREDICEIAAVLCRLRAARNLVLYSNGFETTRVAAAVERILAVAGTTRISVSISIDGFEQEHDLFRRCPGSYARALETIEVLSQMRRSHPQFNVGIGVTLHSGNQHIVNDLAQELYARFHILPGITVVRGRPRASELKDVSLDIYRSVIDDIRSARPPCADFWQAVLRARTVLGHELAYETLCRGRRVYDCYAGTLMAVIGANGDVYPCETLEEMNLGNLRSFDYDLNRLWADKRAEEARKFIKLRKCHCTYECQYTCNTLFNPLFAPRLAAESVRTWARRR